jgi:hypothetical protein
MTSSLYLLFCGPSDERRVCGVFSTRKAAEEALRLGDRWAVIEEHELDAPLPEAPSGHSLFTVQERDSEEQFAFRRDAFLTDPDQRVDFDGQTYSVDVWAMNEDHAVQLGAELIERHKMVQGVPH